MSDPNRAIGAVLLLGSLFWEGAQTAQDGKKGETRKSWRDARLDMAKCRDVEKFPIRYGRRSSSRNGQFTMVFGGPATGTAKLARLKSFLPVNAGGFGEDAKTTLAGEVRALAEAEEIWNDRNKTHFAYWGLVCIAVNPQSTHKVILESLWTKQFRPGDSFDPAFYGEGTVSRDGILQSKLPDGIWEGIGIDFCLLTLTKPDASTPTAREIAAAVELSSYFHRTVQSGIKTAEDAEVIKLLEKDAGANAPSPQK